MYEIEEKWDLSHNDGVFRMSIEDLWRKKGEFKNFIELNKDDDTYSIIPSLENLEKRLMLLIGCSLKEKFGFWRVQHKNFIIELPNAFQKIINSLNNLYFEFRIFENVFSVTLNHNASHLEITYSGKLSRLSVELQKHNIANTNFLDTGLKILDVCRKATLPLSELLPEEVAQLIRETYLSATVKDKKVKIVFREPFASIETLLKEVKKEIAEVGLAEFKSAIISSQDRCIESIKKEAY